VRFNDSEKSAAGSAESEPASCFDLEIDSTSALSWLSSVQVSLQGLSFRVVR
jgi:hypothetical protein